MSKSHEILKFLLVIHATVDATSALIAPLSDIPMFYIKYLTMHTVHMHAGAVRQLLYGCANVREIIHSLKLVDYPPVHTHKPYNNLHNSHAPAQLLLICLSN